MADPIHHLKRVMNTSVPPPDTHRMPPPAADGRWFLVALGLATALIGALFIWLMARSFLRAREMRAWPEVECVILSTKIQERLHDPQSPREYRVDVTFGYEWQGAPHTGGRLTLRGNPWSSNRVLTAQRAAQYPPGTTTTCRVDPGNPGFAVLKPDSLAPGYSIWFPALFVIGGLGISGRALLRQQGKTRL
ncbi:MAG: DUF3592 domain-containing protein [Luteolibacter sp.]|jgi:hypothetical protein|nr:DUF3592 domain-containing protein [Luteolibacter sp.]